MFKKNFFLVFWLGILNLPLALYLAHAYAPAYSASTWFVSLTFISASIGHFFLYFTLGALLLVLPLQVITHHIKKWRFVLAALFMALLHIVLATDAKVFELYRFHINYAMLDLFFNAGGEVIQLSTDTWLTIGVQVLGCILYSALALALGILVVNKGLKSRLYVGLALFCYAMANLTHAYSSAKQILPIVELQSRIPIYHPLTMNSRLVKMGLVSPEEVAQKKITLASQGLFDYPKQDLYYFDHAREPYNVLIIAIDSLRQDMLAPETMPFTYELSKRSIVFNNYYSSSNSTRGGIFGLFYGLPPSYWNVAQSTGVPAAVSKAVLDRNFAYGIFSSANLYMPEFNATVFANIPNLRIQSKGNSTVERDLDAINDFNTFLGELKEDQKFFSFVFLDNAHGYAYPEDFPEHFVPSHIVNHLDLNKDTDRTPIFNRYRNAVRYSDTNIERIVALLDEHGYLQNTIVLITADHGEEFNDSGDNYWGHNSNFSDIQIKVPMVVSWPGKAPEQIDRLTCAYDVTATLLPRVLGVRNPIKDFSIGQDFFDPTERKYVIAGSYLENAIIETDRIVVIDKLGMLNFKDKNFRPSNNTTRDGYLLEAIKDMSYYFKKESDAK